MEITDYVTATTAGIGAVLGVMNTMSALRRDRVRLKVAVVWRSGVKRMSTGAMAYITGEFENAIDHLPEGRLGIRVTNTGFVDVTVDSAGLTASNVFARRSSRDLTRRALIADPFMETELPCRLAPRESVTIWSSMANEELRKPLSKVKRVYASTACGLNFFGTSRLLRALVRRAGKN